MMRKLFLLGPVAFWIVVAPAATGARGAEPQFQTARVSFGAGPTPPAGAAWCGLRLVAAPDGPQLALLGPGQLVADLQPGESLDIEIPAVELPAGATLAANVFSLGGPGAQMRLALGEPGPWRDLPSPPPPLPQAGEGSRAPGGAIHLSFRATSGPAVIRLRELTVAIDGQRLAVPIQLSEFKYGPEAPPAQAAPRPAIEEAIIDWDWRMQDGIQTPRVPTAWDVATRRTLERGDKLLAAIEAGGGGPTDQRAAWDDLWRAWRTARADESTSPAVWEDLWLRVHRLRRQIALANPPAQTGPILLVKQLPSTMSHQLTQYSGRHAKPGGGLFVLEEPGRSMRCRQLAGSLGVGSYQLPDVSYDGRGVLFSFCAIDRIPPDGRSENCHYHLYEVSADGSGLRQLTDGPYDDLAPRRLPDGKILFVSTRRGGFHRCGRGPCPTHTLALAEPDGSRPRVISFHETHEWDPAVLDDGRVIFTRWDYVDRHAVYYEQLWTVRPDGSDVRAFFGNNTLNPVGIWEARSVPGSRRVMATAAAHHAMTAGSIILLDVARGIDGLGPITRLTPDALFPESEAPVLLEPSSQWHAPDGVPSTPPTPEEQERWPGHCYRSPWPLSEDFFLAAYSFDRLVGEPTSNPPNMFGVYLVDRFGNKELLYRDLNVSSLWPMPLRARPVPPRLPSVLARDGAAEGTFILRDVHRSWPSLPAGSIKSLRIVQVLPKSTPHANTPRLGAANASPGKQVLGTVPVEADGSAHFRAPSGVPLLFQALDERGRAVQTMRSLTYLQPGETVSCVGCHEPRSIAPAASGPALAMRREASAIRPGPDGSNPLSYPILVQPVLDARCVACHHREKPEGKVVLTGEPEGEFTASYNALVPRVAYSAWGTIGGNSEPMTPPGRFGARGSKLTSLLEGGHYGVALDESELQRLFTWMDANALFYGTYSPEDQARQQRGERIAGPAIQ